MLRNLRWYRYVWSELTGPTLLGMLLWNFLLLMNHFFIVAEKTLAKNLGFDLTFRMFMLEIPVILVLTIPMSVLLGTLIAVGRLSADQEWVALQGAGHGPGTLMRPVLAFGLLGSAIAFGIFSYVVPRTNYALHNLRGELIFFSNLAADLRPGVFYTQIRNHVMFVDNIKTGTEKKLEGVLVHRTRAHGDSDELILARSGDLYPLPGGSGMLELDLYDGVIHSYNSNEPETYRWGDFERYKVQIDPPAFLRALREPPHTTVRDMQPAELWREYQDARDDTEAHPVQRQTRIRNAVLEINQRVALSLAALLFAALAVPLGIARARSGKAAGLALSLVVILVYWVVYTVTLNQANRAELPAWLGAWSANLVIAPWAVLAYWRMWRSRGERRGPLALLRDALAARRAKRVGRARARTTGQPTPGESRPEAGLPAENPLADLGGTPSRFIARVDQYVGLQFLRVLVFALLAAYMIYAIVELRRLIDGMLKHDQPLTTLLDYFAYALPGMINLALPVSCLVAAVVAFTLLTRTGELTAIKASGVSARRAVVPVVLLTMLVCAVLFLVQDKVAPSTNRKAEAVRDRILGRAPITHGVTAGGRWAFGPGGHRLYNYRLFDPERQVFQGLAAFTLDRRQPRILEHRFSPLARYVPRIDAATGDVEHDWLLEGGWYRAFPQDRPFVYERSTEAFRLPAGEGEASRHDLDPPENFTRTPRTLASSRGGLDDQISLAELGEQIQTLSTSGYDTTRLQVAYWGKLAHPVTPLVMVLLGLPFAFRVGPRSSLYAVGVAFLLVIVYWATFAIFNALGLETVLPPLLAAWAPNVLFSLLGIYLLLYVRT